MVGRKYFFDLTNITFTTSFNKTRISSRDSFSRVMLKKISFKQLQDAGVFVVTSMSINLPHALEVSSKTLWMLRCKIVTSIWTNFEDALDATLQQNTHVKQLQDTVHATFQHPYPFQPTSRTLWMLCCNIRLNQLRRRSGCYVAT